MSSISLPPGMEFIPAPEDPGFGDYRIVRLLGAGGMGRVFEAYSDRQQRRAAIKVMNPDLLNHPGMLDRFLSEARAANTIADPGIITMLEIAQTAQGHPYLVMEFLDGETLSARIARGPLPLPLVLRLGWQLAHSLATAHARGVVHRDLKPDNIMIIPDSAVTGGERTKILDFGIAKLKGAALTQTGARMGTPRYMAPEQMEDTSQVDGHADVYSLGLLLSEMLHGRFAAARCPLPPSTPPPLPTLLWRMQAPTRAERPTMAEVAAALARLTAAPPPRRSWLVTPAALLALGAAIVVLRSLPRSTLPPQPPRPARPGMAWMPGEPPLAVDQTEVSNHAFAAWLNDQRATLTIAGKQRLVQQQGRLLLDLFLPDSGITLDTPGFVVRPQRDALPVVQVTWDGADRYCRAQGKHLPTEAEWTRAASALSAAALTHEPAPCQDVVFGRTPNGPCRDVPPGPAAVGTSRRDRTPQGVHDLAGNVAEWTAPTPGSAVREQAVVRGGDWARPAAALVSGHNTVPAQAVMPNVGFRCALSLPPAGAQP